MTTPTPTEVETVARALWKLRGYPEANFGFYHDGPFVEVMTQAQAALTAIASLGWRRVGDHEVVVPRVPTEAMELAMREWARSHDPSTFADLYEAALSALSAYDQGKA